MTATSAITAFKAYDLRGRIPTELNADSPTASRAAMPSS